MSRASLTPRSIGSWISPAEAGLVVILHNDIDMPYPKEDQEPYELKQLSALFRRHPRTSIIWAHCGVGRVVRPDRASVGSARARAERSRVSSHVSIDISWTGDGKYIVATPEATRRASRRSSIDSPIASCSAPTRSRLEDQGSYLENLRYVPAAVRSAHARSQL